MPRLVPKREQAHDGLGAVDVTPARVETSLLVVQGFRDGSGFQWRAGDRAPLARRDVREAAAANPQWFVVEFSTEPFDPAADWFRQIGETYEARYAEAKRERDGAAERRQQELREELKQQEKGQPNLERRYQKQEKERAEWRERVREQRERETIERQLEYGLGPPGLHN
jgi:hypothetical protein